MNILIELLPGLFLTALAWRVPGGARALYAIAIVWLGYVVYREKADEMATLLLLASPFLALGLLWYGQMVRGAVVLCFAWALGTIWHLEMMYSYAVFTALPGLFFLFRKKLHHPFWEGFLLKVKGP